MDSRELIHGMIQELLVFREVKPRRDGFLHTFEGLPYSGL